MNGSSLGIAYKLQTEMLPHI